MAGSGRPGARLFLDFASERSDWWRALARFDTALRDQGEGAAELEAAYSDLLRSLVRSGARDLAAAVVAGLVEDEAPAGVAAANGAAPGALALLERDLHTLSELARRDLGQEAVAAGLTGLPAASKLAPGPDGSLRGKLLAEVAAWLLTADERPLSTGYLSLLAAHGSGPAAIYPALSWADGRLVGVAHADMPSLGDLVGLSEQIARLTANTEALLAGGPAHDVLLYGPRGSGKSTAVRGLMARYQHRGLRVVELAAEALADLPALLAAVRGKPQRFVLFLDDLSFERDDAGYRPLKGVLQGGLAERPANVVIYATSNRRHLLKERFADRPDPLDDDVHAWDTQHERLALADRFALTITFPDAGQRRYLEIVTELASRLGVAQPGLEERALRFAEWGNGYSGRTARQFVDSLRQAAGQPRG